MAKRYKHTPLPQDGKTIRLLQIRPSLSVDEPVYCYLFEGTREQPYTALSYTWGRAGNEQEIILRGKRLTVRKNLWEFLKRASLSPDYIHQPYWIDAICIDQEKTEEKNHQVAHMSKIYKSAARIHIWLSPWDEMEICCPKEMLMPFRDLQDIETSWAWLKKMLRPGPGARYMYFPPIETCRIIREVLFHRYWRRIWIVQELSVNVPARTVLYGPLAFPIQLLSKFVSYAGDTRNYSRWKQLERTIARRLGNDETFFHFMETSKSRTLTRYKLPLPKCSLGDCNCKAKPSWIWRQFFMLLSMCVILVFMAKDYRWSGRNTVITFAAGNNPGFFDPADGGAREFGPEMLVDNIRTKTHLYFWLWQYERMESTDARDKVYALTTLAGDNLDFPVDYNISVYDLYFRTFSFLLGRLDERQAISDVLLACGLGLPAHMFNLKLADIASLDPKRRSRLLQVVTSIEQHEQGHDLPMRDSRIETLALGSWEWTDTLQWDYVCVQCKHCHSPVFLDLSAWSADQLDPLLPNAPDGWYKISDTLMAVLGALQCFEDEFVPGNDLHHAFVTPDWDGFPEKAIVAESESEWNSIAASDD